MIKKFLSIVGAITVSICYNTIYFLHVNLRYISAMIEISVPYCMYLIGLKMSVARGGVKIGSEIFLPIICTIVIYYLREFANRTGKGNTIPIPEKRFTKVDDDGEVSIENARISELILYMADLEDYMHRRGWM